MEHYTFDTIKIHGQEEELRYSRMKQLSAVPMAKAPPKATKYATLVYELHLQPEHYIRPIVAVPGKHYYDIPHQNTVRGWKTNERFMIHTMLLSGLDRISEWFKAGIVDTGGRVWFVDP